MRIHDIEIENFRRFGHIRVPVFNDLVGEPSDRYLVLGDSGAGKTTVLQAVALVLALACRRIRGIQDFEWAGFLANRYFRWGRPKISLTVEFEPDEIAATNEIAARWWEAQTAEFRDQHRFYEPGDSPTVRLTLNGDRLFADPGPGGVFQFRGRWYLQQLLRSDPRVRPMFARLPGVFWFDQYRNLNSTGPSYYDDRNSVTGIARLRRFLNGWAFDQRNRRPDDTRPDYLAQLESLYASIFPDHRFAGVESVPGYDPQGPDDYFFLLSDGHRTYDLVEMSAGEQAVFPLLYEIVRQQITRSVVLIDEIDLNLHPEAAQNLVMALKRIAPTCQFIFTSHAEAVRDIVSEYEAFSLDGAAVNSGAISQP